MSNIEKVICPKCKREFSFALEGGNKANFQRHLDACQKNLPDKIICLCCKEAKTPEDFYPARLKKRHLMCKACCKAYQKQYTKLHPETVKTWARKRMRKWRERNPELNRDRSQEQSIKHREKRNAYSQEYSKNNRDKKNAQLITHNAVKTGKLIPQPCEVCGNPKVQKHHDDYSKPLEVRWLCSLHHHRHHKWLEDSPQLQSA